MMKYKRISDFPQSQAESISVLGVEDGHNVQMEVLSKNATLQNIQKGVANKANEDGNYPKMTAGFAQEIVGDGSATPEEFSFRPTAGEDRNVANTTYYDGERNGVARIEKIKGNSIVYNQLASEYTSDKYFLQKDNPPIGYWRFYIRNYDYRELMNWHDGILSLTLVPDVNYQGVYQTAKVYPLGTKILCLQKVRYTYNDASLGTALVYDCYCEQVVYAGLSLNDGEWLETATFKEITKEKTLNAIGCRISRPEGGGILDIAYCYFFNLTEMFGAGNEPTTVEEFWQRLPKVIDISEYNEGTIIDGNYGSIKTVGFNAFNGTYAKVCAGCSYYLGGNYTSLGFTTEEGGTLEAITKPTSTESIGTTPSDRLYTPLQNGYIYAEGENININISWGTEYGYLNGTYQPYKPFERDLSWIKTIKDSTGNAIFSNGMRSAGSERDEIRFNSSTQKWEAVQNVGVRAYAEGDSEDTSVTTDGTNTNYALATPIITEITEDINMDFDVSDYGTEELIVEEGVQSAPLVADISYAPNALSTIKQVPDILKRLKALESAVASATATTNEETVE